MKNRSSRAQSILWDNQTLNRRELNREMKKKINNFQNFSKNNES